ncbi:hypothetical protein VTN77DRAFT_2653 [Rasamsonia byssochlamydoides]|uniref:uncharacterized protein n=1 Tax=Rasamsonia byssochlamydoides TaxID=89139 RepID=UPI003743E965
MVLQAIYLELAAAAAVLSIFAVFVYRIVAPRVRARILPERWHPFRNGLAWILFKERVKFSEDVVLDHERGFAIISSDPGRVFWNTIVGPLKDPNPKGHLLLYDYASTGSVRPLELVGFPSTADFHPLGINFFRTPGDPRTRLFVVNHGRNGGTVEVMDVEYEPARAIYVTSISDGDHSIFSPNAVAPVSYTSFYVTNDHYLIKRRHPILAFTETALALPLGWVTFVDFAARETPVCTVAAGGIPYANGIIITPTGKEVLVASTSTDCVRIYERDPETNILSSKYDKVRLNFHPDNLSFDCSLSLDDPTVFDDNGKFLRGVVVAGCPNAGRLFCMNRNPKGCKAPSMVAELRRGNARDPAPYPAVMFSLRNKYCARTLYQSNGKHYPSSTTGDMDSKRGRLIVSGLYAEGILDITWDPKKNPE